MSVMSKSKVNSIIYERLQECRMSDLDREVAMKSLRDADAIVDGLFWIIEKIEHVGSVFLKPSLKH